MLVNNTIVSGNQDQPAVSVGTTGNVHVAWSLREAKDGELIRIFARVYDSLGNPRTAEFQVNDEWRAPQFRPYIAPRLNGGWVVTWTGQFEGDRFFRRNSPMGNSLFVPAALA